ncbi:MAG TPA: deoxyribodipyrimidine photo-lyase [Flavisolibacter sp.]|nr:deoxyribodipyrimidine photo-lyase [Flavisolibacter sp.]
MSTINNPVTVFWFRRDLRLSDNHGLHVALKGANPVLPLFIYDTDILNALSDKKDRRVGFIHQALTGMNEVLKNNGSSMYILNDKPLEAFKKICKQFNVKQVIANHDYEPYAIERDEDIRIYLAGQGIPFTTYKDQVIFEKSEVVKADGTPYTVFPPYSKVWRRKYSEQKPESFPSEDLLTNMVKTKPFHFPSLKDIGFERVEMPGFDTSINEETILRYHETRNLPGIAGTSHISVHLRFGTVSVRHLIGLAARLNENWLTELMWREYFMMILFHFPRVVTRDFKAKFNHIQWRNNRDEFKRWCRGETGYPIVDAGMRELNETGWMHNRVRLITAGFLVKHLLIDWRWGDDYFGQKLLDYELSSNNGNWQWIAGGGSDASPYFRVFNPFEQTKKFDPELKYVKTWVKDYRPGYLPLMVEHDFARKRALEVFKNSLAVTVDYSAR